MPYASVSALFTAICNSIRTKLGTADPIAHQDIPASINAIVVSEGGADVSGVTALAGDVLAPKIFVNSSGVETEGTVTSKGAATYTPSGSAQEIAAGQYLSGKQTIAAVPTEEKSATPTTSAQDITPTSGKFLSKVAVGAIPSAYKDMTTADIVAANVLNGKKGGNTTGVITGTMPNNAGDVAAASYHSTGTSIHVVPVLGYTDGSDDAAVITDADFTAENIKSGVNLFGKAGSLVASIQNKTGTVYGNATGDIVITDIGFTPVFISMRVHIIAESRYFTDVIEYVGGHWVDTWSGAWRENADTSVTFASGTLTIDNLCDENDDVQYSIYG